MVAHDPGTLALRERLKRIDAWTRHKPVAVDHNNEAFYVLDEDGGRWVGKSTAVSGHNQFLAEAICYQLAALLKLPVPEGAYGQEIDELVWFSRLIPNVAHYSAARHALIPTLADFGRVLSLDVWVQNDDRHPGNILLEALTGTFKPWFIDFGTALVGYPDDYLRRVDEVPREGQFAPRTVAAELLREGVSASTAAIQELSGRDVAGVVCEACAVAGFQSHSESLTGALLSRRDTLPMLTDAFLARLGIRS